MTTGFSADIDAGIGFDAITVALLGRSRPWGIFAAGILFGAFKAGGFSMQAAEGIPVDIVLVVQSLIVLFIAAPPLVRAIFRLPAPGRPQLSTATTGQEAAPTVSAVAPRPRRRRSDRRARGDRRQSWKAPIALGVFTVLSPCSLLVVSAATGDTTFRLVDRRRLRSSCPTSSCRRPRPTWIVVACCCVAASPPRRVRSCCTAAQDAALARRRLRARCAWSAS